MQILPPKNSFEHDTQPTTGKNKKISIKKYIEGAVIKLDIVMWNKTENKTITIDVIVPNDYGLDKAERENYKIPKT